MRLQRWVVGAMSVCALLMVLPVIAGDADFTADYNRGNALYREGNFPDALAVYETLITAGVEHPDLYYNASNAAYRGGMLGKAILYQERALRLAPSDRDARANLAFLESRKQDENPVQSNPLITAIAGWYDRCQAGSFALWSALAFAAALLLATLALFTVGLKRRWLWMMTGILLAICALSSGLFALKLHHNLTVTEAIVLTPEVTVHSGPGPDNTSVFTLHEGTKVVIERYQDDWSLIRLASGAAGWIPSDAAARI